MADISQMANFFGFPQEATPEQKVQAVKKKAKKIEKLEKKASRTPQEQRDIDFFEALGMPRSVTSDPNRREKQDAESDKSLLETLRKMGVIG
jgi:hypothetical protein